MWYAGKPLRVQTEAGGYEDRKVNDPVPEAEGWPFRTLEANRNLGRIVWRENPPTPPKRKRGRPRKRPQ